MSADLFPSVVKAITEKENADIFVFCASVDDNNANKFIKLVRSKPVKNPNVIVILTTYGGDPDAGYRIVKALKRYYKGTLTLYIFGSCKSTGTLMALGADAVVMSDFGEFGPLDIQLAKDDELIHTSGLNYYQSLLSLNEQMFNSFELNFINLKRKSENTITTRTAAEISSKLAVGMIAPISGQIDPLKLGEVQRAVKIADAYGSRLTTNEELVSKLIAAYPSHGFVIDFEEAQEIFGSGIVRWVNEEESILEQLLLPTCRKEGSSALITDLVAAVLNDKNTETPPEGETADTVPDNKTTEEPVVEEQHSDSKTKKNNTNGNGKIKQNGKVEVIQTP